MWGFLVFIVAFAGIAATVDQATAAALPEALRPWTGLLAALLITLGLSNIWSLARGNGQGEGSRRALLDRARIGRLPSEDGPVLASGIVRAEGSVLVSPVTGQRCVAYQYRIYERYLVANANWETRVWYWGYAYSPFQLETPSAQLRVAAMPRFVERPTRFEDVADASARAEAYIAATAFEEGAAPISIDGASEFGGVLFTEQREAVRHDWQRIGAPIVTKGLRIEEQVLPVGATASAWGQWVSARQAIVPGTLVSGSPGVAMTAGPPEDLLSAAGGPPSSVTAVTIAAGVLLALGGLVIWAARAGHIAQGWLSITS